MRRQDVLEELQVLSALLFAASRYCPRVRIALSSLSNRLCQCVAKWIENFNTGLFDIGRVARYVNKIFFRRCVR